ncbi:MAG TPA: tRNA-dihydrouridine synthase family protein [Spirochaetota bacterium]|nr:tRNA-dihydrouridine synthase family protein [Spirochaetota bacterium]HPJ36133.1 tRNA-dihydrouridine synthase family protein [Spirochaetota bacterium]
MIDLKKHKFLLAPMAEITTPPFRKCVRSFDPETVLYSEMLSAAAVRVGAMHNVPLMTKNDNDEPFVYQLLGGDPGIMADACVILQESGCSGIDINMGCSAPDIIRKFQGSRILSDIKAASELVKRCRSACSCSLSVKMRSGFEESDEKYLLEFAGMLEGEGVDYITLHPRHGKLSFRRNADWSLVKMLKESLSIPVAGNGDILTPEDAGRCLETSGCDAVMIGRGGVASPWIFSLSRSLVEKGWYSLEVDLLKPYTEVMSGIEETLPDNLHKSRGHRFSFYYMKNFTFSHELMKKIRNLDRIEFMVETLEEYLSRNPNERIKNFTGGVEHGLHEGMEGDHC